MSLINEALRKARQEDAERGASQRGASYRPPRAHLPAQSKLGVGLVLGIVAGFVLAFFSAWWLLRPAADDTTPTVQEPVQAVESNASESNASESNVSESDVPATGQSVRSTAPKPAKRSAEASPAIPLANPSAVARATPPTESLGSLDSLRPEPQTPTATSAESVSGGAPLVERQHKPGASAALPQASQEEIDLPKLIEPPESVGHVADTNEFVLQADLGEVTLTLDFIVWSSTKPFAQINGRQVEVGQQVESFLVVGIERDRVRLRGANGALILRIR